MKKITAFILIISLTIPNFALARGVRRVKLPTNTVNISTAHAAAEQEQAQEQAQPQTATQPQAEPQPVDCSFTMPKNPEYSAQFLAVRKKGYVAKKELFETRVFMVNTGNVPWFSADSGCNALIANLGTDKNRDRHSPFFVDKLMWKSNWAGANRITMQTKRVDPRQVATFTFWSQAPDKDGLFREYYAPVIEEKTWMDGGLFSTDIKVGEPNVDPAKKDLLAYIQKSTNLAEIDLNGDKNIEVDISSQRMWLKIGDFVIKEFPVSTGTYRTPTPLGTTNILKKMDVRVAAKRPHYIMPKWMTFRAGGFGIHALPSLGNDGGVFWREALNHIGTRRSHGCIRLLPQDAEFAYNFTEVGTKVVVHN